MRFLSSAVLVNICVKRVIELRKEIVPQKIISILVSSSRFFLINQIIPNPVKRKHRPNTIVITNNVSNPKDRILTTK